MKDAIQTKSLLPLSKVGGFTVSSYAVRIFAVLRVLRQMIQSVMKSPKNAAELAILKEPTIRSREIASISDTTLNTHAQRGSPVTPETIAANFFLFLSYHKQIKISIGRQKITDRIFCVLS